MVNPIVVEGQVHGGVTQGIAQALFEHAVYDGEGNLATGTLVDYLVPSAADVPSYVTDRTETPSTTNPLGVKGVGEAGAIASTPAVVNAVVDALRPYGVQDVEMPCTPQRVWRAVQAVRTPDRGHRPALATGRADRRIHRRRCPVIPVAFDYEAPTTVDGAVQALAAAAERDVKVLGGGQSLFVLRMRLAAPELLVDLSRVEELRGVRDDGDAIVLGAMTTHDEVVRDPLVRQHALLLSEAAATVADPQVRHRGTFGGNLVHCDPAGDMSATALALEAQMVVAGPGGRRTVEAEDFFEDLFQSALQPGEILVEVRVPKHTGWGAHYEKFQRVAQAWSIVGVAATVRAEGGTIAEARVALTNMAATPVRARGVEEALVGQPATEEAVRAAAERAARAPTTTDANADADYRRHLAGVLTRRAVLAAAGSA